MAGLGRLGEFAYSYYTEFKYLPTFDRVGDNVYFIYLFKKYLCSLMNYLVLLWHHIRFWNDRDK
jgi:hypothetical protein